MLKAKNGADVLVINAMGRVFMTEIDCPFRAVDREITACGLKSGADVILVDFHAEATSEKQALGYFVDGRVSVVVGTHTHTPTSDERILPSGTAYMSDAGMCGDYNSVLGMDTEEPMNRFLTRLPRERFEPAQGPATVSGLAVEIDDKTGLAVRVKSLRLGGVLEPTEPLFWVD
jgi:metallophosphoesterase (TIGR00282 family)